MGQMEAILREREREWERVGEKGEKKEAQNTNHFGKAHKLMRR